MNKQRRGRSIKNSAYNFFNSTEKWGCRTSVAATRNSSEDKDDEYFDETKDETHKEVTDWIEEFFGRQSVASNIDDQEEEIHLNIRQTMILATLLPDELLGLKNLSTPQSERFVGVLMMADVSGYTALSEKYNCMGQSGTYRLTATLNGYIGALVELIYSYGGDIIKFAGDAFLALFKTDKRTFLYHTIHNVICCALIIQNSYGDYETDVKVNLRVKLAISAGNITFATIGPSTDMNYVIIGLPVLEAKQAESVCGSGEVTLTPTAWAHCYTRNYIYDLHADGHATIHSILYDPREIDVSKPFPGIATLIRQIKKQPNASEDYLNEMWNTNFSRADFRKKRDIFSLRKNIITAAERNIGKYTRNFMIRPVLTQVDAHQPIEYLTEMRQVSVLFLTFKPKECPIHQLITIVDNAYTITCTIVYKSLGCVNKIILFDKDVMILVIFGLRGFKHESEAQAALKCASSIRKSVAELDGVLRASIGVTTGVVYCGVVGHPLRREFTVIGAIVNKAARLMCNFYNKITCDETTFIKSKMSSNGFTLLPNISLKGIQNPGKIYEYNEQIRIKEVNSISVIQPLLNRTQEVLFFDSWLTKRNGTDALLLVGETRIGKTRLLQWFKRCSQIKGFKPFCIRLTTIHASTPYLALAQMIDKILEIPDESPIDFIKEEKVVQLLGTCDEDLCFLNKILKIRFAFHESAHAISQDNRIMKAKLLFKKLMNSLHRKYLIAFDDLQNLDASSWDFVEEMLTVPKTTVVLTLNRAKLSPVHNWITRVLNNEKIKKMLIGPLSSHWIAPLACQILDVNAVPSDLCTAMQSKCGGTPGTIENFLVHLFSSGALQLIKVSEQELSDLEHESLIFPESDLVRPIALYAKDQQALDKFYDEADAEGQREIKICLVSDKPQLLDNISVQNFDALIMMQIDSLTPYQQLLLKIASVIGNVFSRDLLENIMYENDTLLSAKAVKKLFDARIIACAHISDRKYSSNNMMSRFVPHCECQFDYDLECNLPKYAFCKVIKFRSKYSRQSCYELLPLNQKKEFHTRIVNHLETNGRQKCVDCGGNITVVQSTANLNNIKITDDITVDDERKADSNSETVRKNTQRSISLKVSESADKISRSGIEAGKTIPILKTQSANESQIVRRSNKCVTISNEPRYSIPLDIKETKILESFRTVMEAKNLDTWHALGVRDSKDDVNSSSKFSTRDTFFSIPIKKGVSAINFQRCTCAELTILTYEQHAYHASKAELKIKALNFLLTHCYYALLYNNHYAAIPKLEEAEEMLDQMKNEFKKHKRRQLFGRIHSLKGYAFLLSGNILAAKLSVAQAAEFYRIRFHKISKLFKAFLNIKLHCKNKNNLSKNPILNDIIFFYNIATLMYTTMGEDRTAKRSSTRALNLVLRLNCRITDLLDTFTNALQVDIDRGFIGTTIATEKMMRDKVKKIAEPLGADELQSVGKLYFTVFRAQLSRGDVVAAVRSGYQTCSLSLFLNCHIIFLDVGPQLFYALLSRARIFECVALLQVILRLKQSITDKKIDILQGSDTWYYALCMDAILDGGFQVESPQEIHRYGEEVIKKGTSASDPSKYRLLTNLWVYWLRVKDDNAKIYEEAVLDWFRDKEEDETLCGLLTAMRFAEGMLEGLNNKIDDLKKVVHILELRSVAEKELNKLEGDSELMRIVHPRWLTLKAHCLNLCGHKNSAIQKFLQAYDISRLIDNKLQQETVKSVSTSSSFWMHSAQVGNFISWQNIADYVRNSWNMFMYNITFTKLNLGSRDQKHSIISRNNKE